MKMTRWALLFAALALAMTGCAAAIKVVPDAEPAMNQEWCAGNITCTDGDVKAGGTRAAAHTDLQVSQVSEFRDRVRITHWPDNVTDAYFSSGTVDGDMGRCRAQTERHIAHHHDQVPSQGDYANSA